jgi:glycosyltransferase involved in cell wall biosynthesis
MTAHRTPVTLIVSHLEPMLGIERAALQWATAMADQRPVSLVAIGGGLPPGHTLPDGVAFRSLGGLLRDGHRVLAVRRLRGFVRRLPTAEPIVVAGIWAAVPMLLAGRRFRDRTIVWEHSLDPGNVAHSRGLRVLATLAGALYPRSRSVVTVSRTLAGHVHRLTGVTACEIPNFVDRRPRTARPSRRRRLLAVGSLTDTKNYRVAIEALPHLASDVTLEIFGTGPLHDELLSRATELGLRHRVTLHGYVPSEQIPWHDFAAFVHPAHGETFGYALYEAADAGLPVVATNASVMSELIPVQIPGVTAVPEARQFAAAIADVLNDGVSDETYARTRALRDERLDPAGIIGSWNRILEAAR